MSNHLLRDIGEILYESCWEHNLAHDLGEAPGTIRRWLDSTAALPHHVILDLQMLCLKRALILDGAIERLKIAAQRTEPL